MRTTAAAMHTIPLSSIWKFGAEFQNTTADSNATIETHFITWVYIQPPRLDAELRERSR
jgi:hypothetical protein